MKKISLILFVLLFACYREPSDLGPWLFERIHVGIDMDREKPLDYWEERGFEIQQTFDGKQYEYFIITPIKDKEPVDGIINLSYNANKTGEILKIFLDMTKEEGKKFIEEIEKKEHQVQEMENGSEDWVYNDMVVNVSYLEENEMYSFYIYSIADRERDFFK